MDRDMHEVCPNLGDKRNSEKREIVINIYQLSSFSLNQSVCRLQYEQSWHFSKNTLSIPYNFDMDDRMKSAATFHPIACPQLLLSLQCKHPLLSLPTIATSCQCHVAAACYRRSLLIGCEWQRWSMQWIGRPTIQLK